MQISLFIQFCFSGGIILILVHSLHIQFSKKWLKKKLLLSGAEERKTVANEVIDVAMKSFG